MIKKTALSSTLTVLLLLAVTTSAKSPIPTPPDTPVVGYLDAYLLETLYTTDDTDTGLNASVNTERFKDLIAKPDPEVAFQCIALEKEVVYSLTLKRSQLQVK